MESKEKIINFFNENELEVSSMWKCDSKSNPLNYCVYDKNSYVCGDNCCIFCGKPEERK